MLSAHPPASSSRQQARPYALIVRATERCEVGCDHCSIDARRDGMDLTSALLERALDGARSAGVGLIHFSGGEPLVNSRLEEFVAAALARGFETEVTTSTFTTKGEDTTDRVRSLRAAGLARVMLSYDAAHARTVAIDQYARFMLEAQREGIETCAVVVEWPGAAWNVQRLKAECARRGVDVDRVDWCRTDLSLEGRAARRYQTVPPSGCDARCPYVLTAPTLRPDGVVQLCPNLQSRSRLFVIGDVRERPLDALLAEMLSSPLYRSLALLGPHRAAMAMGLESPPADMCACCRSVLAAAEDPEAQARLVAAGPTGEEDVLLVMEALLPAHQRFVRGESRPEGACTCE